MKKKSKLPVFPMLVLSLLAAVFPNASRAEKAPQAKGVSLRVDGSPAAGFHVTVLADGVAIDDQSRCGEFSLWLENGDASVKDAVKNWKASEWTGDSSHVELSGTVSLAFVANLRITVTYDVINEHVVRKRMSFFQSNMPLMLFKTTHRIEPVSAPKSYWSFDEPNSAGGYLHDLFPAIGYQTRDGITVGLLTDAGFRNHYTRIYRRRPEANQTGGLTALAEMPDARLLEICSAEQRTAGEHFLSQTFGEIITKDGAKSYDRLTIGQENVKTVFLFVDDGLQDNLHDLRLASQVYLAEGLGFVGGETEKVFYATLMSLLWITEPYDFHAHSVPSMNYAPDMYNRDSAYSLWACDNRVLNEQVFRRWGDTQGPDGAIGTIVTPLMGSTENKSNEATPEWLIWAMLNRRRYNTPLPMERLAKAARYTLDTFDPDRDGICRAKFVMGMNDIVDFPDWTEDHAVNQGVWAVTLRTIKELDIPEISESISEEYIEKAEEAYRSYYNTDKALFCPKHSVDDVLCLDSFHPEFMSLWLFNRKILTDEMVVNSLDKLPMFWAREDAPFPQEGREGVIAPISIWLKADAPNGWAYFTEDYHPVANDEFAKSYAGKARDGMYYNGGSWLRPEILAYAAGKRHGWDKADARIANRLWAEIHLCEDFPTSQEYLATTQKNRDRCDHRVFSWNVFALAALEMLGQRTAEMDPDHRDRDDKSKRQSH